MENGILRICVGTSDLARSAAFFTRELELTEVCRGTLAPEHVRGLYGLDCSADYLMLRNDEQPTLLQLIQLNGVPGRPIRAGRPSWDFDTTTWPSARRTTAPPTTGSPPRAAATTARPRGTWRTGSTWTCWRAFCAARTSSCWP